jgi:hypothetical protein
VQRLSREHKDTRAVERPRLEDGNCQQSSREVT